MSLVSLGIVVSGDARINESVRCYVLCLDKIETQSVHKVFPVSEKAFQLPKNKINAELSERKNLIRRLGQPLLFGDFIEWNEKDVEDGFIIRFDRAKKLIESRANNGKLQLQLEGVINPEDPNFIFTKFFPKISISADQVRRALPNLFYQVWINVSVNLNSQMSVEFDSFAKLSEWSTQEDLGALPWNLNQGKYNLVCLPYESDDDDYLQLESDPTECDSQHLFNRLGVVTGEREFFVDTMPLIRFILPLLEPIPLKMGSVHKLDAVYDRFEDRYLVILHKFQRNILSCPLDEQDRLRCSVRAVDGLVGVFRSDKFGLLDDPEGILSMLHLSPYATSSVPVSIVDGPPSRCAFRFRIVEIQGDKAGKLKKWKETGEIGVSKATGIVVGKNTVFSAQHTPLFFHFKDEDDGPAIGTTVKFDASYQLSEQKFVIEQWRPDNSKEAVPFVMKRLMQCTPKEEQVVFRVNARVPSFEKTLKEMLFCPEFGLLDDRNVIKKIDITKTYTVWITLSVPDIDSSMRPSRSAFHVISLGEKEPEDKVKISEFGLMAKNSALKKPVSPAAVQPSSSSRFSAPQQPPPGLVPNGMGGRQTESNGRVFARSGAAPLGANGKAQPVATGSRFSAPSSSLASSGTSASCSQQKPAFTQPQNGSGPAKSAEVKRSSTVEKFKKTIYDLRARFKHLDSCGKTCDENCPYVHQLSKFVLENLNGLDSCRLEYPDLYNDVYREIGATGHNY